MQYYVWAGPTVATPEGETMYSWHRHYFKKINGQNIYFEIDLDQGGIVDTSETAYYDSSEIWKTYKLLRKYNMIEDLGIDTTTSCETIMMMEANKKNHDESSKALDDCHAKNDSILRPIASKIYRLETTSKFLNSLINEPTNISYYKEAKNVIDSFDIATSMPSIITNSVTEKTSNWCRDYPNTKTPADINGLWVYTEDLSDTKHVQTIRHVCQKNIELFSLNMNWSTATPDYGDVTITAENSIETIPEISTNKQDIEFVLLGMIDKKNPTQISFKIGRYLYIFDKMWGALQLIQFPNQLKTPLN